MKDDAASAIADYTKAIILAPTYADAYLNRGLSHWERAAAREAAHDLAKAVDLGLRPELESQARYFLARAREAMGDQERAYKDYLHVVVIAAGTPYGDDAASRSLAMKIRAEGSERGARKAAPKKANVKQAAPEREGAKKKVATEKKVTPKKKVATEKVAPKRKRAHQQR